MTKEKTNLDNKNILLWIIVLLLIIIVIMWFFLIKSVSNSNSNTNNNTTTTNNSSNSEVTNWVEDNTNNNYEELTITVYDDKRCTNCMTDEIINQLKQLPSIWKANIIRKDFSDEWVSDYLENIKFWWNLNENWAQNWEANNLPLFVFSTNNFDESKDTTIDPNTNQEIPKLSTFLQELSDGNYMLMVWSTFNPFQERSEKGYLLLDKEKLETIKNESYISWNKDAKITWLEYSDLECPFCAKLHKDTTKENLKEKYWEDLNIIFNHFPLSFHQNAQKWAEVLECLGEQKWSEAYNELVDYSFANAKQLEDWNIDASESSSKDFLIKKAVELWANEEELKKCVDDWKYAEKVKNQMNNWAEIFKITWTPWNVLINNETWEYEIISWAYPTSSFIEIIDWLLK